MKRALKAAGIGALLVWGAVAAWCVAYPVLFSDRYHADQAQFQQWLADHSSTDR
jgi:hypothetical protein